MARIRTIKPDFFTSEDIVTLPPFARLLYQALWCEADRQGRLIWKPGTYKYRYFPADDLDIQELCAKLVGSLVWLWEDDGITYAWIPTFLKHQSVNFKEAPSHLPRHPRDNTSPTGETYEIGASGTRPAPVATRKPRVTDPSPRDGNAPQEEGKGREGKGRKEGMDVPIFGPPAPFDSAAAFEAWYAAHPPGKKDREDAEKAWASEKVTAAKFAEIMAGQARAMAAYRLENDMAVTNPWRFFKGPGPWLRSKKWLTDYILPGENGEPVAVAADGGRPTVNYYNRFQSMAAFPEAHSPDDFLDAAELAIAQDPSDKPVIWAWLANHGMVAPDV